MKNNIDKTYRIYYKILEDIMGLIVLSIVFNIIPMVILPLVYKNIPSSIPVFVDLWGNTVVSMEK
jgi:hypothetical protein